MIMNNLIMIIIGALGNAENPYIAWVVAPYRVLSMGQVELNLVLMLNLIDWNRTVDMYKKRFNIK